MNPLLAAAPSRQDSPVQLMAKKPFWANMTLGLCLVSLGLVMGVCSSCASVPEGDGGPAVNLSEENKPKFEQLVKEANALYDQQPRNEARLKESIAKFNEAYKLANTDYTMLWQGARSYCWLAGYASSGRLEYAKTGIEQYARTSLKVKPDATEGLFYLSVLSGYLAKEDNSYGLDAVKLIEESCKKIIDRGDDIANGGAHRVYGVLMINPKLPGPPTSIGSLRNGKKQLELALQKAPEWPENHLYMADAELQWAKDRGKPESAKSARERLDKYLLGENAKAPEGHEFEFKRWQEKARELLTQYQ